jgi:hypothetical protein
MQICNLRTFLEKILRVEKTTFDNKAVRNPASWKSNSVVHARAIPKVVTISEVNSSRLGRNPTTKKEMITAKRGSEAFNGKKRGKISDWAEKTKARSVNDFFYPRTLIVCVKDAVDLAVLILVKTVPTPCTNPRRIRIFNSCVVEKYWMRRREPSATRPPTTPAKLWHSVNSMGRSCFNKKSLL